eukprot:87464-Amphidinium_carterae.1
MSLRQELFLESGMQCQSHMDQTCRVGHGDKPTSAVDWQTRHRLIGNSILNQKTCLQETDKAESGKDIHASCAEYVEIFKEADKNVDGLIEASDAKRVMDQSELPPVELAHIWALCDEDRDGRLTLEEFLCAMHLISLRRNGSELPTELPIELLEMAQTVAQENPAPRLSAQEPVDASWHVLARGMAEYREAFRDLDASSSGYISVQTAMELMERSELPFGDLAYILRLCDMDRDGRLSFGEFVGALHLVSARRRGGPLPSSLPPDVST